MSDCQHCGGPIPLRTHAKQRTSYCSAPCSWAGRAARAKAWKQRQREERAAEGRPVQGRGPRCQESTARAICWLLDNDPHAATVWRERICERAALAAAGRL